MKTMMELRRAQLMIIMLTAIGAATVLAGPFPIPGPTGRENSTSQTANGKYANVNGLKMYYEVHGTGRPLVLLHGAFGLATVFPTLARNRQLIAVELQAHRRVARADRRISGVADAGAQQVADMEHKSAATSTAT